jgi:hypothetical protein
MSRGLNRVRIIEALNELSMVLKDMEISGHLCICGGAGMVLAFDARESTLDVDAILEPAQEIRFAASKVAKKLEFPEYWLNDAVKGFFRNSIIRTTSGMPQFTNLLVTRPSTEDFFCMKCAACRIGENSFDRDDIFLLARELGLKSAAEARKVLESKGTIVPQRAFYLLEELLGGSWDEAT